MGAPISVEISGEDYAQLASLSARAQAMIKDDPRARRPEGQLQRRKARDRGRSSTGRSAGLLWMSTARSPTRSARPSTASRRRKYRVGEDEYKIRVRLREDQRSSPADLENLYITFMNKQGKTALHPPRLGRGHPPDRKRSRTSSGRTRSASSRVTGDVQGTPRLGGAADVKTTLARLELPSGYTIKYTGEDEEQTEGRRRSSSRALVITLLLVFLVAGDGVQFDPGAVRDHALRAPLADRRADRAARHAHPVQRHHDGGRE